MKVVVVKYNAGNIRSVDDALNRLNVHAEITDNPEKIASADKVIFPGVGEASTAMNYLRERNLDQVLKALKQPFLGVCLGQQLMCAHSEEGDVDCLGIFNEKVRRFRPTDNSIKVPHMGWNSIYDLKTPLFKGVSENCYVYFVHSYYVEAGPDTIATCNYVQPFAASLHKENFYSCQFHPEKSADVGAKIISNFLAL